MQSPVNVAVLEKARRLITSTNVIPCEKNREGMGPLVRAIPIGKRQGEKREVFPIRRVQFGKEKRGTGIMSGAGGRGGGRNSGHLSPTSPGKGEKIHFNLGSTDDEARSMTDNDANKISVTAPSG